MKRIVLLGLLALSAVACNPVKGSLTILKPFTYVNPASENMIRFCRFHPTDSYCRDVDLSNPTITFQAGTYTAKLEFPSKSKLNLVIRGASPQRENSLTFNIPKDQRIPAVSGAFALTAQQTGQQFDLNGTVDTQISDSASTRGWETCSEVVYVRVCHIEPSPNPRIPPREVCSAEPVVRYGNEDVEYFYRTTDKNVLMDLLQPGQSTQIAHFSGTATDNEKIYTYRSGCILNGLGIGGPGPHPGAEPIRRGGRW